MITEGAATHAILKNFIPGTSSSGSVTVAIPAAGPAGTYHLITCADDTKKVTGIDETNSCVASATAVVAGPSAGTGRNQ